MEEKDEKGFSIRDRRTASSEAREESPQGQPESAAQKQADTARTEEHTEAGPLPELDFSSFIISLATTAQVSLGLLPNPQTSLSAQNLPAAKQMIDILALLREKTKGNLTEQEQSIFDNILYGLRMQYVTAAGGKK